MGPTITLQSLLLSDIAAFASGVFLTVVLGVGRRRTDTRTEGASIEQNVGAISLDESADAILRFDQSLACIFASAATTRILGRSPVEVTGGSLLELACEDTAPILSAVSRARAGQTGAEAVFRATRATGEQFWVEARFSAADADGHLVAVLRDVSTRKTAELALRVANLELNKLAGTDGLTGLPNRRRFDQTLETECRRASRGMKPVSLLLVDVDRFKSYNERYGHKAGDACLKEIGLALRAAAARMTGVAARFGGEEFVLLLPGVDEASVAGIAEQIREDVAGLALPHEGNPEAPGVVTVSIGCATSRPMPDTLRDDGAGLITGADRALYDAKRLGRNRVVAPTHGSETGMATERLVSDATRLARLDAFRAEGTILPSANLHRIARMAAVLLGMPMAFVALLDQDEVVIVGHHGMTDTPLRVPHGFCAHLLGARGAVVVTEVAEDARFRDFGADHGITFLAAAPLLSGDDLQHVGALWVFDRQARGALDEPKRMLLSRLAALVMEDLEARRANSAQLQKVA